MSVPAGNPGRSVGHRIVSQVVRAPLGRRFGRNIASRVDPTLIRLTRGHVSSVWPFPAVVMTHVGAKFGRTRSNALVYFTDRGRVILIASNFGGSRNPAWYHNVEANSFVTLCGCGIGGRIIAKQVYDAERDRLYQRAKGVPGPHGQSLAGGGHPNQMCSCHCIYAAELLVRPRCGRPCAQRFVRFGRSDRRARNWLRTVSTNSGSRPCPPRRKPNHGPTTSRLKG
jgi:deazaflavin-dependent oxidoreductase (nitroreductase family)